MPEGSRWLGDGAGRGGRGPGGESQARGRPPPKYSFVLICAGQMSINTHFNFVCFYSKNAKILISNTHQYSFVLIWFRRPPGQEFRPRGGPGGRGWGLEGVRLPQASFFPKPFRTRCSHRLRIIFTAKFPATLTSTRSRLCSVCLPQNCAYKGHVAL